MSTETMITIKLTDYEAIKFKADEMERRYNKLTKELNTFFFESDIKLEFNPRTLSKMFYVTLDYDKIDGKLRGYFEHRVKHFR